MRIPQVGRANGKDHWTSGLFLLAIGSWSNNFNLRNLGVVFWCSVIAPIFFFLPPSFIMSCSTKFQCWCFCLPQRTSAMTSYQKGNLLHLQSDSCSFYTGSQQENLGQNPVSMCPLLLVQAIWMWYLKVLYGTYIPMSCWQSVNIHCQQRTITQHEEKKEEKKKDSALWTNFPELVLKRSV